jgi:hypothetical protein
MEVFTFLKSEFVDTRLVTSPFELSFNQGTLPTSQASIYILDLLQREHKPFVFTLVNNVVMVLIPTTHTNCP